MAIFTWWNGATVGTSLFTRLNGREVGHDDAGNIYFQHRKNPARRWVIYNGDNDGSRVPPVWQAWLRGTINDLPDKIMPPKREFEQPPTANLTGRDDSYRPSGSLLRGDRRPASTGDYQPWTPD